MKTGLSDFSMQRRIIGFHQDEQGEWVADLECGHGQHIRHKPPWTNHPWVLTAEGRQQWIGAELACKRCDLQEEITDNTRQTFDKMM